MTSSPDRRSEPGTIPWLGRFTATALPIILSVLTLPSDLVAQISPGELSRPHAGIDGSANCLQCHESGKGVNRDRCLDCHQILASRIGAGLGLHGNDDYQQCETCHIEHHGIDFELIWWGEEGRETFDHGETGYELSGAHGKLACEKCHNPQRIAQPKELIEGKKDLQRTFLGLEQRCLGCHFDEHRGQVVAGSCLTCHDTLAWKPASAFDHEQARFGLAGRHGEVACTKCHATKRDPSSADRDTFLQFAVMAFGRCTDCHRDPHEGRLGTDCAKCHSPASWSQLNQRQFNHSQTRFALVGQHQRVACVRCHPSDTRFRVARFEECADCHGDVHFGQFADRSNGGTCESCHTADRFSPATFTWQAHQETDYPLEGAHLATACNGCHQTVPLQMLAQKMRRSLVPQESQSEVVLQFQFGSTHCLECHQDPHRGEVDKLIQTTGCEVCHHVSTWRQIAFDHDGTEFALLGKHAQVDCKECHPQPESESGHQVIRMTEASSECSSCHKDPHLGQFSDDERQGRCDRCHGSDAWKSLVFDHTRDARYALDGAHNRVSCDGCHPPDTGGDLTFIRYRPLGFRCEDCHGGIEPFSN